MYSEMRRETSIAFAFRKGFNYSEQISNSLIAFRELGIIDEIVNKWIYIPYCSKYESEDQRFPWFYFGGILLLIVVSFVVSIAVNLIENLYTYCKHTQKTFIEE